jgi:hypothetical protein
MTSPLSKKHLSKLKRAHPEADKIVLLTEHMVGYWRTEIDFVEDFTIRFTSSSPSLNHSVAYYNRDFTFNDNLLYLLTRYNIISSLDFLKPDHMGHPGGYSMFVQTIQWYDLGEFVNAEGMLDVDIALLENQRAFCGRLRAIDRSSSTLENTQESMGLEDSSIVSL